MQDSIVMGCRHGRRIFAYPYDEGTAFVMKRGEGRMTLRSRVGVRALCSMLCCAAALAPFSAAQAGHEISYYPSFYPQEIRIEALTPGAAAKEFLNTTDP